MKILYEEGNQTICTYQDLESWNRFALAEAPSQWECLIYPSGLTLNQENNRYLCLTAHIDSQLAWIAKISQDDKGNGVWLAGSKLFNTNSQSRELLRLACHKLGIKESLSLDKPFCFSPAFPEAAATSSRLSNETFVHTQLLAKDLTPEKLNQLAFLAQHAWTRRGAPGVDTHFFKSALVQLAGSSKLEIFVTKVDQIIRCFVIGFEGKLIAWGALSPDRDQKMLQLLLQYSNFKKENQNIANRPSISNESNNSLFVKAWSSFKKPKTYVMATAGPAMAASSVVTFQISNENLSGVVMEPQRHAHGLHDCG